MKTPELDHDKLMFVKYGHTVSIIGKAERRIVFGLINHLLAAGFSLHSVYDSEEETRVSKPKEAMELIFNLDEASLRFYRDKYDDWHGVLIVLGNGEDAISDWNYFADDHDGFNAAMEKFDVEKYT